MARKMLKVAAGVTALLGLGAGAVTATGVMGAADAAVSSAAGSPTTGPAWTSVGPAGAAGVVTAVTTVVYSGGKLAEFAFASNGDKPSMWARSGSESWAHAGIPVAKAGEEVVSAKAIGPNEVLLATDIGMTRGRLLEVTGHSVKKGSTTTTSYTWSVLKAFNRAIGSASILTASDIWLFGPFSGTGSLGAEHYNGKTWTLVGKSLGPGSAASAKNVWAASGLTLEHYNGAKWTGTSIAGLLSTKDAAVSDVYTGDGGAPYALVTEATAAARTALVVLEYNGHAWKKVATYAKGGQVTSAAGDGASGLWIAINEGTKPGVLLHFHNAGHTLTASSVPGITGNAAGGTVYSIAQVPGTTKELAGGFSGARQAKIYYYN